MDNFQLYRTNILLGGQIKWDIVIDSADNELYVSDFHLSPISDNIAYTYKSDENLISNKHQDNVKAYYNVIKGSFYNEGLDSVFNHNWPIIAKEADVVNAYSNTYDMGCRRSKHYDRYHKQFEFLCPLWLEHLNGTLKFVLSIKGSNGDTVFASNALTLDMKSLQYHNKFVKYFNSYIADAKTNAGNDNLLNINFDDYTSTISGLDASNGLFTTKELSSLVNNITMRERPLMEVDSMLIESFKNSNMIASQLINFNLCFNINDIMSGSIVNMMLGSDAIVSVDAYIDDKPLEKRDFYTNYEYIEKQSVSTSSTISNDAITKQKLNVLDYLHDYSAIDLITKNKFCQKICHWSLCDNNNYIFNVYNGFSGVYIEEDGDDIKIYENDHQYGITPNTIIKHDDKGQNSTGWINCYDANTWNKFYRFVRDPEKYRSLCTRINNETYINNIKYKASSKTDKDFYVVGLFVKGHLLESIVDTFKSEIMHICDDKFYALLKNDILMLITIDSDYLSFGKMVDILHNMQLNDFETIDESYKSYIKCIYDMMQNKIDTKLIVFGGSLLWNICEGPSKSITEISYYKDNSVQEYVSRYDGKIKPTFISDTKNALYYKDCIYDDATELKNTVYSKYNKSGFEPLYPSIGYFAIKKTDRWSFDEVPKTFVNDFKKTIYHEPEYSWFNNSTVLILEPEIKFTYINKRQLDGSYRSSYEAVCEYLKAQYNITDDNTINYIASRYEIDNDWDYFSDTNVDDYKYNITIRLK